MENMIYLIFLCAGPVSLQRNLVTAEENLAFRGTATQSTTYYTGVAAKAIDGITYGTDAYSYCSTSSYDNSPWWRLDLLDIYEISTVIITARSDGYPEQTVGAEIRIGNSLENNGNNNPRCAVIPGIQSGTSIILSCKGMTGRYVNIMKLVGPYLSLCEVELYESENLAFNGTATQSSTITPMVAASAIDGIRHTPGPGTCCSSTSNEYGPWWRLDLVNYYEISSVVISNRGDSYTEFTNGAEIRIGNSLENNGNNNPICAVISGLPLLSTANYSCDGMLGRYVNVIQVVTNYLTLCEVEVYGRVAHERKKTFLRLKFSSSFDAAAMSDTILQQLQSILAFHISDFQLSWTQLPKQEVKQNNENPCDKNP